MAAKFDYNKIGFVADTIVKFFGMPCVLRRATASPTDRPCIAAIVEYTPKDRPADLANPTDRHAVMSAIDPSTGALMEVPPDNEQDVLVTFVQPPSDPPVEKEVMHMTCDPKVTAPAGIPVVWEFSVRL